MKDFTVTLISNGSEQYFSDNTLTNFTKLIEIYDEGKTAEGPGVLAFKCSQENNKMDVYYLNEYNKM